MKNLMHVLTNAKTPSKQTKPKTPSAQTKPKTPIPTRPPQGWPQAKASACNPHPWDADHNKICPGVSTKLWEHEQGDGICSECPRYADCHKCHQCVSCYGCHECPETCNGKPHICMSRGWTHDIQCEQDTQKQQKAETQAYNIGDVTPAAYRIVTGRGDNDTDRKDTVKRCG